MKKKSNALREPLTILFISQSRAELAQIKQEEVEGIEREDNTDEVDQCLQKTTRPILQNTMEKIEALHGWSDALYTYWKKYCIQINENMFVIIFILFE